MSEFLWCSVTKRVIDSPTVRVRGDESDSGDDEEDDFCAPLIGENQEHYVDAGSNNVIFLYLVVCVK